ncbi:hypothetical protein GJ699_09450 [Duganella sp. FT80W]|uniref:Uncharacterized protein n=1 Tax=Duganella guangzhouensis TaxID=2666084 RepID=A0A6I2KW29_9BURK|nr:hypothetical protein [Duganella guangzhouensis]MRW90208.1 hypothetical protein [Duganella guangzhouensis]
MHNPEANDFFPSSLAGTALGMLLPVISPKRRPMFNGAALHSDETIRQIGVVMLFLGTFLWLATVYLSIGGQWPVGWIGGNVDQKFWISVTLYVTVFLLNEWKERI